jgi:protein tyrosine/serine phosphatase
MFCLCSLAALADDNITVDTPKFKNKKKEDLPNFHKVNDYLYRGGEPSEKGLLKLKEMGIKTIIDLRGHPGNVKKEQAFAQRLGLKCINLPMSSKAPTQEQVATFLKEVAMAKDSKEPLFVHCAHGSDRTGCMVGIWRVVEQDWTYDKAYKEMRKYYFTPKFTELSGAVKQRAKSGNTQDR